jgi:hypothetical protein
MMHFEWRAGRLLAAELRISLTYSATHWLTDSPWRSTGLL